MMAEHSPAGPTGSPVGPAGVAAGRGGTPDARTEFWRRSLRGWDTAFYLMTAIAAVTFVLVRPAGSGLPIALGLLVVLAAAYTVIGRSAARLGDRRRAIAYLVVLVVVTVGVTRIEPAGSVMLFLAYSQIWFFTSSRRSGVVACSVLTVGVFGAIAAYEGFESGALPQVMTQGAIALVFAVLLGLWVTQVAEQSSERADLVVRLEAAQAEIGRSQHAAGVAAERERMAQEIHDTLAQGFTSIVMLAQTAAGDLRRGNADRAADRIDLVERTARDNLAEARALVAAFAPVGLDGAGLGEALERLARRFTQETGVQVGVRLPEGGALPIGRDREVILLRAAQEALANVRRHADARHVQLVLDAGSGDDAVGTAHSVQLEVIDDGRGIAAGAAEGFGLRGMRDRVTSGGGELEVSTPQGGGTRVRVSLPTLDTSDAADPTTEKVAR